MKKISLILSTVLFLNAAFCQQTWKSDKGHSQLTFTITHLGISDVSGLFERFDATITTNKEDFSDAKFELTADAASINTNIAMRDNHLKGADFFDTANHPKITFRTATIDKNGDNRYKLTGDLTFHGVTKPVTLDLWYRGTITNQRSKALTAGFQVTGTIKRSDFQFGSKFAAPMLGEDIAIKADGEFVKQ